MDGEKRKKINGRINNETKTLLISLPPKAYAAGLSRQYAPHPIILRPFCQEEFFHKRHASLSVRRRVPRAQRFNGGNLFGVERGTSFSYSSLIEGLPMALCRSQTIRLLKYDEEGPLPYQVGGEARMKMCILKLRIDKG
jgi:hypothetical protein